MDEIERRHPSLVLSDDVVPNAGYYVDIEHQKKAEIGDLEGHFELLADIHVIDNALEPHDPEHFQKAEEIE